MSWRDNMRPASFREAPFHVATAERAGGRRAVTHEFPFQDTPAHEDLGRKVRPFTVEGYVLGDEYLTAKEALIAALEMEGPGQLVHPYYGTRLVVCTGFTVRESADEGGLARISVTFEETSGAPANPTAVLDAAALLEASATAAMDAAGADFVAMFAVDGEPGFALESLTETLQSAGAAMDQALAPALEGAQAVAEMKARVADLVEAAASLIRRPVELVDAWRAAVEDLGTDVLAPLLGYEALLQLAAFESTAPRPETPTSTRELEQANYDVLLQFLRVVVLVQAGRLAPEQPWGSYQEAVAARDELVDALDERREAAGDDGYPALAQLRADLVRAVPGEESDLPRLAVYTPPASVPSLVLAHQLYGNVEMEEDILARNRVVHPGFVLGGRPLEVISSG